ncbi:hypothetical protein ACKFKG_32785 [Phormidesmis sp. 146-35]
MTFTVARSRCLAFLSLICVGCVQVRSSKTELTMQVEPAQQRGAYTVTGKTTLPDRTQITVQALRTLQPGDRLSNQQPTYSILSRTQVEVKEGKWEATLNLLRTPQGQPQEVWQTGRAGLNLEPDTKVTFLAVTDPVARSLDVAQGTDSLVVRFTADGRSYLQADQVLTISPPTPPISQRDLTSQRVRVAAKAIERSDDLKGQTDAAIAPQAVLR